MIGHLRRVFQDASPIASWPDLQSKAFHAMLRSVAGLMIHQDARGAVEEIIAARTRELLEQPDPTDLGNPFSFMAWIAANHAQTVRDQRDLLRAMFIAMPILCAIASLVGALVGAMIMR